MCVSIYLCVCVFACCALGAVSSVSVCLGFNYAICLAVPGLGRRLLLRIVLGLGLNKICLSSGLGLKLLGSAKPQPGRWCSPFSSHLVAPCSIWHVWSEVCCGSWPLLLMLLLLWHRCGCGCSSIAISHTHTHT